MATLAGSRVQTPAVRRAARLPVPVLSRAPIQVKVVRRSKVRARAAPRVERLELPARSKVRRQVVRQVNRAGRKPPVALKVVRPKVAALEVAPVSSKVAHKMVPWVAPARSRVPILVALHFKVPTPGAPAVHSRERTRAALVRSRVLRRVPLVPRSVAAPTAALYRAVQGRRAQVRFRAPIRAAVLVHFKALRQVVLAR